MNLGPLDIHPQACDFATLQCGTGTESTELVLWWLNLCLSRGEGQVRVSDVNSLPGCAAELHIGTGVACSERCAPGSLRVSVAIKLREPYDVPWGFAL